MCCTHSVLLLCADGATLCVPYSTLPYSLLWGCGPTLLCVRLTLHDPILGCGHTLSLRRCGDCLVCVFLMLYLYNVVSGHCDPHFVFTPRILRVTWVSKSLLTLPLLFIITTRHYHYSTLHYLPTLLLLAPHLGCGHTLLYVRLTLLCPILGCGHTLSLRQCGDCLICVFLILYLYNVVGGDCGPHFVFTPQILRVTWVSKSLLTLPLLSIITTRHYLYSTLHDLPTLPLLSPQ